MKARVLCGPLLAASLCGSCSITTNIVNIGQKTSLERQLMGEAEPLTEEEVLAASVRAREGTVQAGSPDDLQSRALAARQRQLFNRDDVDELKQKGCLGEGRDARLTRRPCDDAQATETSALLDKLISEENADREAIIDWAIGIDPVLTASDRPQVVSIYHALLVDRARSGDWLQGKGGVWQQR